MKIVREFVVGTEYWLDDIFVEKGIYLRHEGKWICFKPTTDMFAGDDGIVRFGHGWSIDDFKEVV